MKIAARQRGVSDYRGDVVGTRRGRNPEGPEKNKKGFEIRAGLMIRTPWEHRGNTTRTRVHTREHAGTPREHRVNTA
jgi:hypothetical protein